MTRNLQVAWFFVMMFGISSLIGMHEISKLKSEAKDLRATTEAAVEESKSKGELLDDDVVVLEEVGDRLMKCERQLEVMNSIYNDDVEMKLYSCRADLEHVESKWSACIGEAAKSRPTVGR